MQRGQLLVDYQKYEPHYQNISQHIRHEPQPDRRCTDCGFVIIFLLVLGAFFGIGVMEMSDYNAMYRVNAEQGMLKDDALDFSKFAAVIAAGIGSSVAISFAYVFLLKAFPRPMVYFMIVLSLSVLGGMALIGLFIGNLGLFIGMGVTFLIYGLVLFCLRKKIDTGIALVKIATKFISEKLQIFLTPLVKLVLTFLIGAFYIYSLSAMIQIMNSKSDRGEDTSKEAGLISLWAFFWLFFMFVFYYMMTYAISVVCSYWYYGIRGSKGSLLNAYVMMAKQFGSIVFAALLVAVVTFARMAVDAKRRENKNVAVAVCLCIVACLLKAVEDLLKVLNHYTIIMISVTGESYIDGAKSTMGLLWKQLGLMSITNIICNFLVIWGLIISCGLPCILVYFLMQSLSATNQQISNIVILVAVSSILISTMVFEIIVESVSCIFIYYALDKDMVERGLVQEKRLAQDMHMVINRYSSNPYLMDGDAGKDGYGRV